MQENPLIFSLWVVHVPPRRVYVRPTPPPPRRPVVVPKPKPQATPQPRTNTGRFGGNRSHGGKR